nr:hypothetical protein [uncultured Ruminococcus sp.]
MILIFLGEIESEDEFDGWFENNRKQNENLYKTSLAKPGYSDVDGDAEATILDATWIQRRESEFSAPELIDLTLSQDNEASFTAESFSVYVIKSHETDDSVQTPRKTFRFLSNNFADYECTDDEDNPLTGYYVSDLYEFPNKANEMVSYTRTENTDYSLQYEGTLYTKVNGAMVELAEGEGYTGEGYTGEVYGIVEDSYYEELRRRDEATYTWKIGDEVYTGPRYTRSSKTGSMLTWTGLFGQTFAQNGYTWSTVNDYSWSGVGADGKTTTQTLLDGFTEGVNPYNLEQGESSGKNTIYHYKQQLDGKYTVEDRYTAYYSGNSVNFNFSNKFDSFTVAGYSSSFNQNFNPDQPGTREHKVGPGGSASLSGTIHIYHTRKKFTLTLASFTTANNSPDEPNDKEIKGIYYEQPLSFLTPDDLTPPDREN